MPKPTDLIGAHPSAPSVFARWLNATDTQSEDDKGCIRDMNAIVASNPDLVDWLAKRIIHHHYEDDLLDRLKAKFADVGFPQYASQNRRLPKADPKNSNKTRKGNFVEILLIEYIEACQGKPLIKTYKLRYNPNVDQSVKGDDTLLVNAFKNTAGIDQLRVFLGESKFRVPVQKAVVDEICASLGKDKLPLSYGFLVSSLFRDNDTENAKLLDSFLIQQIKDKGDLHYVSLLMGGTDASKVAKKHFASDNPKLVFVTLGIADPAQLITDAFERATFLVNNPVAL
jgi:hypothetical protein